MYIKLFVFNVRCALFHFFYAIMKICVVFVEEIILRAIPVKHGRKLIHIHIHLNNKLHVTSTTTSSIKETVIYCILSLSFIYLTIHNLLQNLQIINSFHCKILAWFSWVGFYGTSTIVVYLMLSHVYT